MSSSNFEIAADLLYNSDIDFQGCSVGLDLQWFWPWGYLLYPVVTSTAIVIDQYFLSLQKDTSPYCYSDSVCIMYCFTIESMRELQILVWG